MNMRATGLTLAMLALEAGCGGGGGGGGAAAPEGPVNGKPTVVFSIPNWFTVTTTDEITFTVTVNDPEGDAVDIDLLNVPTGMVFDPIRAATPPVTATFEWHTHIASCGVQNLYVRATDARGASRTERLTIRVTGRSNGQGLYVGDVTGDGVLDAVIAARYADLNTIANVGAVFVYAGRVLPNGTPTATLAIPNAASGDRLSDVPGGAGVQLADVTNDGVLDVVVGASFADLGATTDAGMICVWQGGGGLTGTPTPRATLTIPNATNGDRLGDMGSGNGIEILDFTGDGIPDILAGASYWDSPTLTDVGAIFLWAGGAGLTGTPAPRATLRVASPTASDQLGLSWWGWPNGHTLVCEDVTGDGRVDLVVPTPLADNGTTADPGAVYVWAGGPTFTGTQNPQSILRIGGAVQWDYLGGVNSGRGVRVADVTGDGTPDIIVGATYVDAGANQDAGAVYVWGGGSALTSTPTPLATLAVTVGTSGEQITGTNGGEGMRIADVTGDGTPDVLVMASWLDSGATQNVGAVFVWAGGSAMTASSTPSPAATLRPPSGTQWQSFPDGTGTNGVELADVTGDGTLDLVCASPWADAGATLNVGAVYVWAGGSSLTGTPSVRATLQHPSPVANDDFGYATSDSWSRDVRLVDLTGDGLADILVASAYVDGTVQDQGGIWVWAGGSSLTGTPSALATLKHANPVLGDEMAYLWGAGETGCVDVTGDGLRDIVTGAVYADLSATQDTGAMWVWNGGTALSGSPSALATLRRPTVAQWDYLGGPGGSGASFHLVDVNGDGMLDIVVGAANADVGGVQDVGLVLAFAGGPTLAGTPLPRSTLVVPGAVQWDNLGSTWNEGRLIADFTDDGRVDVLVGAAYADVGSVVDAGAAYLWPGGSIHVGQLLLRATFTAPTPTTSDNLGN